MENAETKTPEDLSLEWYDQQIEGAKQQILILQGGLQTLIQLRALEEKRVSATTTKEE